MGVADISRRQFLAGSAAAGVSLSLDKLVLGHSKISVPSEVLAMLAALNMIQDKREPVPGDASLKEAEKGLQKLFEEQYKARKAEFADVLLNSVASENGDKRYVMLRDSAQIAAENFKLSTSFAALEKMVETYQVKMDPIVSEALKVSKKKAQTPAQSAELTEFGLKIVDLGMKWNEYDAAVRAVTEAKSAASKSADKSLVDKTNEKLKEVTLLKKEFDEYVKAEDGLKKIKFEDTLTDPKKKADYERYNLITGKWQCFKEDKWNLGIYILPLGSDTDLASIAVKEQKLFENKVPLTAENFYDMAEAWYDKAKKKDTDPRDKGRYNGRALHWYDKTLESATGALKGKVETRINELGAAGVAGRNIVDLLKMIDVKKDAVKGEWTLNGKLLISPKELGSRVQVIYAPPEEYDLIIDASRTEGSNSLSIGLVAGKRQCTVQLDGDVNGDMSGINMIDNKYYNENGTRYQGKIFVNGKRTSIICSVRKTGINVSADGKTIINWRGDYSKVSPQPELKVPNETAFVIGTWDSKYHITQLSLRPISPQK